MLKIGPIIAGKGNFTNVACRRQWRTWIIRFHLNIRLEEEFVEKSGFRRAQRAKKKISFFWNKTSALVSGISGKSDTKILGGKWGWNFIFWDF